ncbi:GGDEF domain-containing protein [Alteromonas sp. ASW11-36]|uniref:diguanylate cyclase n=1 Tax=Alteromonas arenosi TaxID=3055817 RepID=A0ABT7SVZ7_9ALTE|nr:GGDEF domain-containing protein [Alteromonas sp. ASW11-36]MDM7860363.1 GGDEF domain-containing protein [Alteromonas sp. ASW11-36]
MKKFNEKIPNFVVNSTKNIALISSVILFPFLVVDVIQGQYLIAAGIAALMSLYVLAAYRCHRGKYSLKLSLFGIAPVITVLSIYSLYKLGISASFWSFAAVFVLYFALPLRLAASINVVFIIIVTPFAYKVMPSNEFSRFFLVLIGTSGFLFMCVREIYSQNRLLIKLSFTDALTGLKNRATLTDALLHAININQRYRTPMTILMIDIDNFKTINDLYGHITGDNTLKSIATLMRDNFREPDTLYRIGGEEFLVVLHDTPAESAQPIAERFRLAVENASLIANHKVTVSIGVCELTVEKSPQKWISLCDKRLYRAKAQGRNRIVCM